ncbi:unnamed protein product [Adineta steineri]|uniref:Uncharacterized protein n=1 Tax=Adineta steineri TaxID=433720 RepID=A0A818LFX8_9BILA|nr:unnamed protein product [Adineta steineri]CAF3571812.1 unnamed protein product [Adineta steineri]
MVNLPAINERTILTAILGILGVATLFCLIGLATSGWGGYGVFKLLHPSTGSLCILSLLLLIACIIVGAVILLNLYQHEYLPLAFVSLMIITSIFLLGAFSSFISAINITSIYSYNLVVTAFAFTYLSSILATYWLFGARQTTSAATPEPVKQPI